MKAPPPPPPRTVNFDFFRFSVSFIITLCMKLPQLLYANSRQLFCNCPRSRSLFWRATSQGFESCCYFAVASCLKMAETWAAHGLIIINTKRMLIWRSICHLSLIKYYFSFMENFEELTER